MHRILQRQLKKIGYDTNGISPENFKELLQYVDQVYNDCDDDRSFLEHTLDVSSEEMHQLYKELEEKSKTKLAQSEAKYRALAKQDALTKIANRYALEERLDELISFSKRNNSTFAVLFLDLDHFKYINDSLGHDFGDLLLQEVVKRVSKQLRKEDLFARLGGDEFVIVFTNITEDTIHKTVEKILSLFREPWQIEDHLLHVSTSIGVVFYPKDGENVNDLLKHADIAMYEAKNLGRDSFSFYTKELNSKVIHNIEIESDMQEALDNGEFELYYQPKVSVDDFTIIGAEALIRWNHPKYGLLLPDEFIPIAEGNGFIIKLGEWVLEQTCKDIELFNTKSTQKLQVSANVSMKQLQIYSIYETIERIVENIDASQLVLEVTESILMKDVEFAVSMLHQLKDLGVKISLDDFGIGFSSLSQLSTLPIDSLKIDKVFIDQIPHDAQNNKILLNTIIAMVQTLDICFIAEGVEEDFQLQFLKEHGCPYFQGNLFSKPLKKEEFLKLITS